MKTLVVGCGSIGRRHLGNLKLLGEGPLTAMDPLPERREAAAADFGVQTFSGLEAALADQPGAVVICSPNSLHMEQAMAALKAGCHVFVEKPLSHNLDGVAELEALAREKNATAMVGSNFKFHPAFVKMKEILDSGAIGRVLSARCQFGQYLPDWHPAEDFRHGYSARKDLGGGVLLDSHELAYMAWFMGCEVDRVFCFCGKVSDLEIETEDTAEVLLSFSNQTLAEVHLDYTQRAYQRNYEFFGARGTLIWDFNLGRVRLYSADSGKWTEYVQDPDYDINRMYVDEMAHFLNCARNGAKTLTDFSEGRRILSLIMAAKASCEYGRAMELSEGLLQ